MAARIAKLDADQLVWGEHLLWLATSLAALTGTEVEITNFRDGPGGAGGFKTSHLALVQWFAAACSAETHGATAYNDTMTFTPAADIASADGSMRPQLPATVELGATGHVCEAIEAILPYLIFAGALHPENADRPTLRKVTINGGTIKGGTLSWEYVQHVLLPTLERIGLPPIHVELHDRGFKTEMSSMTLTVESLPVGAELLPWSLVKRGLIERIEVYGIIPAFLGPLEHEIAVALAKDFKGVQVDWHLETNDSACYLLFVAVTENGHRLGRDYWYREALNHRRHEIPAKMIQALVSQLKDERKNGACIDVSMQQRLVLYQALASGRCFVDLGNNTDENPGVVTGVETARYVTAEILGVEWSKKSTCRGVGYVVGEPLRAA